MIRSSRGKDFQAKQEGNDTNDRKLFKAPSSSRQWSAGFKNPRIIRVSRSFGGKDRHSKVCTVRGLRDRRIRLSVPTAIQLYDLQDRLGLNQPSKVIDWLLDVAKDDVDKLPPLQIPLGNLGQFLQPTLVSHDQSNASTQPSLSQFFDANSTFMKDGGSHSLLSRKQGIKINDNLDGGNQTIMPKSKHWYLDYDLKGKSKEVGSESIADQKTKWMKTNEVENQDGIGSYNTQVSAQNYFPLANPYNSYYHWEASSNLSLSSQLGSQGFPISETDQYLHNSANAALQMPPPFAIPSGSQLFFCPPATTLPSLFPPYLPYITAPLVENNLQALNSTTSLMPSFHSISSPMKSFPPILNVNPMFLPLQSNNQPKANKNGTGP